MATRKPRHTASPAEKAARYAARRDNAIGVLNKIWPRHTFTVGYIGNVGPGYDNRSFYLWCATLRKARGMYAGNALSVGLGDATTLHDTNWDAVLGGMIRKVLAALDGTEYNDFSEFTSRS